MPFIGNNDMARDLRDRAKKIRRLARNAAEDTMGEMYREAQRRVPQPGGSPYRSDHPWAEGGLRDSMYRGRVKAEKDVYSSYIVSDQPPAGSLTQAGRKVQEGYGVAWDEGDAPYMRDTVEHTKAFLEDVIPNIAAELD